MPETARRVPGMAISVRSTAIHQAGGDPEIAQAAAEAIAAGETLLIRVSPQLYRNKAYSGWRATAWTVSVPGVEEGEAFKEALTAFFAAVATGELPALVATLEGFREGAR